KGSVAYRNADETVGLNFSEAIPKGEAELFLKFKGKLSENMRGFYKSRYKVGETEKILATTQFESTDARRAFPCVDEPEAKAIFDVTMIVPKNHEAISNTIPTEIAEHESGYKVVRFAPTPKMSTYLLAFISGELESIEGENKDGVLVRVFTTHGKKKQAEFALEVAKRSLEFYTEYFGIPYPLPVLDMIGAPDFAAGAMENWGAVTYRESALLVDPDHTATEAKQWVALVIAHELAHQWFGNLVTMKWWTDLWLNEGFASYIEYLAVDHIFPEWEIWKQFVAADLSAALRLDGLQTTHPIEVPVNHPHEISEIFDAVSYSKGASVIRMLAEHLGEKSFRKGLHNYLKRHSYGNAETKDLWKALEEASGKPVGKIMAEWTKRGGYPLITLRPVKKGIELRQSRFYTSSLSRKSSKDKTIWRVPLIWKAPGDKKEEHLILSRKVDVLDKFKPQVKLNSKETGVYRVSYSESTLSGFYPDIITKRMSAVDRLGLVRDIFALAESGESETTAALALLEAYRDEDEYVVWREIVSGLGRLSTVLIGTETHELLKKFKRKLFAPAAEKFGWLPRAGEPHTVPMLRDMLIYQAGVSGEEKIVDDAVEQFERYARGGKAPQKDIRTAVYYLAARSGGKARFEKIKKMHKAAKLPDEKERLEESLGLFRDTALLHEALAYALSKDVRPQDFAHIYGSVARNEFGRELAWKFLKKHWPKLLKIYGVGGLKTSRTIEPLSSMTDEKYAGEIESFFRGKKFGVERTVAQTVEKIRSNVSWRKRAETSVLSFFSAMEI
ncbi:MAG: M1 family metallopeptidase, partial [Candidatus Taylorbacteria bacterium]|nr:M1 family metallopeptidase [Candidatus Taylorbacteria bacterium]